VTWGEQSKDEMGAVGLMGVPHDEADLKTLQTSVRQHTMGAAQLRMMADPGYMKKIQEKFGETRPNQ
jgi:hypothetical protein